MNDPPELRRVVSRPGHPLLGRKQTEHRFFGHQRTHWGCRGCGAGYWLPFQTPPSWTGLCDQQSASAPRARQMLCRAWGSDPTRSVRKVVRIGWILSKEATLSTPSPWSSPTSISVGMPRTVLVIGATTIHVRTGIASERVTTRTGRRLSSASAHQMSPWDGVTKVLRRSCEPLLHPPNPTRPQSGACVDIPERSHRPSDAAVTGRSAPEDRVSPRQIVRQQHPR